MPSSTQDNELLQRGQLSSVLPPMESARKRLIELCNARATLMHTTSLLFLSSPDLKFEINESLAERFKTAVENEIDTLVKENPILKTRISSNYVLIGQGN